MLTIGIDPGLYGAVGVLRDGEFVSVADIPTSLKGSGVVKYEIDPAGLRRMIQASIPAGSVGEVFLERVNAMPGQGVSSVFSLGDSFGVCRSVVSSLNMELHVHPPMTWKKFYNLGSDKEECRALATRLFPTAELHLKKYADRAEALLMARFLWLKFHA